jgi:hypothetical protein
LCVFRAPLQREIGEITRLISDITEQTNVLARAAIQAASAGEEQVADSPSLEEVQRLAETLGECDTRQFLLSSKPFQTDTQDAVRRYGTFNPGVVEGAAFSDNVPGTAFVEIGWSYATSC